MSRRGNISCVHFVYRYCTNLFWLFFAVFRFSNFSTEQNTTINSESNVTATADQVNHRDNNSKERSTADNKVLSSSNGKQSSSSSSLGKRRKSTKSKKSHHSQQQQHADPNINYKNLDEWLENSIKGMSVNDQNSFMPNNGSPIHGTSSAFTVNNSNPFINTHHPLFNPNMLPPYMARPWSEMVSYVIISCHNTLHWAIFSLSLLTF